MQPDFIIQEDAASVLLKTRWMACYTLRDSYPGHASRCFESLDQRRRGQSLPSSPGLTMNLPSRISRQPITKSLPKKSRTLCRQPSKNGAETGLPSK